MKWAIPILLLTTSTLALGAERAKLDGYAEWRRDGALIVEGQVVRGDRATRFEGERSARSFASIPAGYEVKVEGTRLADGSVLARKVEAKPNGNAMFEGQLKAAFDSTEAQWREHGRIVEGGHDLGRLRESGAAVARARRITRRLIPPYRDSSEFRVYVVDNDEWNAMAAPNGSVYVFRGLLDAFDDDEVAIVLGHEIAHQTHEHSRKQYKRSMWTQLAFAGGMAALSRGDRATREITGAAAGLGALAFTNHYSREHEDQADRVGLRYAHEGGYDVTKAPGLWKKFGAKYRSQPEALNFFFGDHSTPASRAQALQREIAWNYAGR